MVRLRLLLAAAVVVVVTTVVVADPLASGPTAPRAIPGDGALDAPVPGVGEMGGPSRILDPTEMQQWLRGRALFDHDFTPDEGLGSPGMNADSCRACHQDPLIGGAGGLELNVSRFGHHDGVGFIDLTGGQGLSKLFPPTEAGREEYDPDDAVTPANVFEQRQTPALFGAGLIDSIPDAEILSGERMTPDADGVLGIARIIGATGMDEVGRFGWKAQLPHLGDFIRDAFGAEMGVTTGDPGMRTFGLRTDADAAADPEVGEPGFDDMLFFLSNLAPPPQGRIQSAERDEGETLFTTIGCAACHTPTLAGAGGPVPLFSDLLLHDVSPDDFQGMEEPGAANGFYRTPPLWGNCFTAPYMHDGAAETVEEAILAHDGEALVIRQRYEALTDDEKAALLLFLSDI